MAEAAVVIPRVAGAFAALLPHRFWLWRRQCREHPSRAQLLGTAFALPGSALWRYRVPPNRPRRGSMKNSD
ncbi:MAG: hypothetical protein IJP66_07930, partial [Kiritimatiellae bacterium]|nr:hypothetical protein [Kiritimatiellia bacterium]